MLPTRFCFTTVSHVALVVLYWMCLPSTPLRAQKKSVSPSAATFPPITSSGARTLRVPRQYNSIQSAIDRASPGDTVLVAEGTYFENLWIRRNVVLASLFIADGDTSHISKTIIDGSKPKDPNEGSVIRIEGQTDTSTVLCGFTICGGTGEFIVMPENGQPLLTGGGIVVRTSGATITNNIVRHNSLTPGSRADISAGGGMNVWSPIYGRAYSVIQDNIVMENTIVGLSTKGAGIAFFQGGRISGNVIIGNVATATITAMGGGMSVDVDSVNQLTVENNYIARNLAGRGGGIYASTWWGSLRIVNNIIVRNMADERGGGYHYNGNPNIPSISHVLFAYNTVAENVALSLGGGISVWLSRNDIVNNILWNNRPDQIASTRTNRVQFNLVQGGYPGRGNIDVDPYFNRGDSLFGLAPESPAMDIAADSLVFLGDRVLLPKKDFRGMPRPVGVRPDLGALEAQTTPNRGRENRHPQREQTSEHSYSLVIHLEQIGQDTVLTELGTRALTGRVMAKVSLDGTPLALVGDREFQQVTIPPDNNLLEVEFIHHDVPDPFPIRGKPSIRHFMTNFWLKGIDQQLQMIEQSQYTRYTNLPPGLYQLEVHPTDANAHYTSANSFIIPVIVLSPWWRTDVAYLLYALLLGAIAYFVWSSRLKALRIRHQFQLSKFEAEKMQELDEMKSRFFTNISHEFRTPLTLILGPVKQIAERVEDEKTKEELGLVHRNARKLLTLVNQLLDISKIESGNMKLQASPRNMVPLLKNLVVAFTPHAERKKIALKFTATEPVIMAFVDKEKFESIITNVLSNAFKFTPETGQIDVGVYKEDNRVNIRISDTGIGIPNEKLPKIFDRFYQVDGTHTREQEGTGIGLALTKELVDLHKGTITVESEEGKGTVITIGIPLGTKHLKQEEIVQQSAGEEKSGVTDLASVHSVETPQASPPDNLWMDSSRPIVLLVEDNADVRYYIRQNIKDDYCLLETADGEEGWVKATECLPDIIVSDIMMPKMDGYELCRKLKTDERTSHIPVILLTAKASIPDKIQGFETGADAYIMKPFEVEELKARIKNLIDQRKRIHGHFRKQGFAGIDDSRLVSIDKRFLQKVYRSISDNISNSSLSVESLAEAVAVSRSVLHRKIVSLTGEPPVELIRRIRLARAAELITKNFGNMTEIAYEVGFTNPSYFSECFKKQFGVSPSQYSADSAIR